ncbi:hypothetical protein EV702DRAFT_1268569 [Suillus placidus]|uniref:Uncharacterized protein n=1 Tax=Suillus placidus TaxID=48579 RepID=A0A9P7D2F0_9AGAM|nr:hypothetical protein EV702DRAFT_1268569 [Suillus placidus]
MMRFDLAKGLRTHCPTPNWRNFASLRFMYLLMGVSTEVQAIVFTSNLLSRDKQLTYTQIRPCQR